MIERGSTHLIMFDKMNLEYKNKDRRRYFIKVFIRNKMNYSYKKKDKSIKDILF